MSLNKAIQYGKEKRKPYLKSKAVSNHCRNHGCCDYCRDNRLHKFEKAETESSLHLKETLESLEENNDNYYFEEFFEDPWYFYYIDYEEEKNDTNSKTNNDECCE